MCFSNQGRGFAYIVHGRIILHPKANNNLENLPLDDHYANIAIPVPPPIIIFQNDNDMLVTEPSRANPAIEWMGRNDAATIEPARIPKVLWRQSHRTTDAVRAGPEKLPTSV